MADTTTTTATLIEVTTTTTTPMPPLGKVETAFFRKVDSELIEVETINASDSTQTHRRSLASSFTFGSVAAGEILKPIIVMLRVPYAKKIRNIKIALVNAGGIPFENDIFGVSYSSQLSDKIIPSIYFQGINTEDNYDNSYNVAVDNTTETTSAYVYLSLNMPLDYYAKSGLVRFKWFFDYMV